ncbi:MAG: 50S ribosomal protein L11 methyltransferase [bacterium]
MSGYLEVSCDCPAEAAELVCFFITENLAQGVVTEDVGDRVAVRFYLPNDDTGQAAWAQFRQHLHATELLGVDEIEGKVTVRTIADADWLGDYEAQFGSVQVDDIVIKPSWDESDYSDKLVILMDPKMAFGTGRHETTKLCMRQVREDIRPGDRLLDFGTGSGVLSILAAKLGAAECLGIDNDPLAVENSTENAELNDVGDKFSVRLGSIEQVDKLGYYDVVVSNLIYEGLLQFYDRLAAAAKPNSVIILSGILVSQEESFLGFLRRRGVERATVARMNEWTCIRIAGGAR